MSQEEQDGKYMVTSFQKLFYIFHQDFLITDRFLFVFDWLVGIFYENPLFSLAVSRSCEKSGSKRKKFLFKKTIYSVLFKK